MFCCHKGQQRCLVFQIKLRISTVHKDISGMFSSRECAVSEHGSGETLALLGSGVLGVYISDSNEVRLLHMQDTSVSHGVGLV